jgi:putative FmdB family regulatory protein
MPVYTYRCESCGVQFEQSQKFTDSPLVRCPECGKKSLRKVYTPVGIVFKGSGFYSTDHRSPSGAARYSKDQAESKAAESKSTESKPAEAKTGESKTAESKTSESTVEKKSTTSSTSDSGSTSKADKKE